MGLLDDAIREHLDLKRARGADPAEIERLEREALGPVRRDPSIASMMPEPDFESSQDYEDDDYVDDVPESRHQEPVEEVESPQPKRRFLRRNRGAERAVEEHAAQNTHESEPDEFAAYRELHEHDEDRGDEPATEMHDAVEPPQLTFNRPPSRPRFTADPPADEPSDGDESARPQHELQPTHEFDVAGAFHDQANADRAEHATKPAEQLDESAEASEQDAEEPEQPAEPPYRSAEGTEVPAQETEESAEDEDVLEETPEFLQDTPEHDRLWFEQRPPKDFDFDN